MLSDLFFLAPKIFFIFMFAFPAEIIFVEKLPQLFQFNVGELDKDDIKKLPKDKRDDLTKKMIVYSAASFVVTLLIGLAFFYFADGDNVLQVSLCNLINTAAGSVIFLQIRRTAKIYKREM